MKRKNEQTIGEAIRHMIKELGIEEQILCAQAEQAFEKMMGSYIMGYIKSFQIKNKELLIKIDSPELKNELMMGKSKIKDHINSELKKDYLTEIKFL